MVHRQRSTGPALEFRSAPVKPVLCLLSFVVLFMLSSNIAFAAGVAIGGTDSNGNISRELRRDPLLSKVDIARLAQYAANNEPVVVLAVAAYAGQNSLIAAAVGRHGGRVDFRLDEIDYLTAVLPIDAVRAFLAEPGLRAVAVDNINTEQADEAGSLAARAFAQQRPSRDLAATVAEREGGTHFDPTRTVQLPARPLEDLYSVLRDMDGDAFRRRDLRFDGRGVVIAQIENFPDFLSPELRLAKDANGKDIPKFADVINVPAPQLSLDPDAGRRGDCWTTRLSPPVVSNGPILEHDGKSLKVPRPGTFRLAQFELPSSGFGTYVYPHVRKLRARSAMLRESAPLLLDVLWSERDQRLWIDINGNGDFSDERGVGEYRSSHEFGVFGEDNPTTPVRESVPYAVQVDGDYLGINMAYSVHATMVAGAAAASRGKEGILDGIAPGAQLIPIAFDGGVSSIATYIRALGTAYLDRRVDVVLVEGHLQISGAYERVDGQSLLAIVQDRLVKKFPKPTLITAGNNPWMSAIMDFTASPSVVSVGASQSAQSLFSYYGIKTARAQDLHWVGSEGPAGDGGLKPDILAPANPVSVSNRDRLKPNYQIYPGVFRLPIGYLICSGTSCAAPVAAGAAALLVGAAKLHGLPHDADAIHQALRNSAKFVENLPAYKQGSGIIQVDAAWRYLNALASERKHYEITIEAPVRTAWSDTLLQPHLGRGLFEREGWRPNTRQERIVMVTRRTGPKRPLRFSIKWQGNADAFSSKDAVILPLNIPVPLKIGVAVGPPGVYSATARLIGPGQSAAAALIPATIVVPHEFAAKGNFSWNGKVLLDRPGRHNIFFRIPAGTKAFTVSMRTARESMILALVSPYNPNHMSAYAISEKHYDRAHDDPAPAATVESPEPGVWEVVLTDRRDSWDFDWQSAGQDYLPPTEVEVSAKIIGVSATVVDKKVQLENRFARFEGRVESIALGGRRSFHTKMRPVQPLVCDLDIEAGQELAGVTIEQVAGARHDVDLFLFDCTRGICDIAGSGTKRGSHEQVIIERPKAGKWKIVALALGAGQGPSEVAYTEYYTHPNLGTFNTNDAMQWREPGETWQAKFNLWRADQPRKGYKSAGIIQIVDPKVRIRQNEAHAAVASRSAYIGFRPFLLPGETDRVSAEEAACATPNES